MYIVLLAMVIFILVKSVKLSNEDKKKQFQENRIVEALAIIRRNYQQ